MDCSAGSTRNEAEIGIPPLQTPEVFSFPYTKPYDIQVQLMRVVFEAIENGKIAIVESPTGTGKSLTLLTSTLTWLKANEKRLQEHSMSEFERRLKEAGNDDPPWVIQHSLQAHLQDLKSKESTNLERLAKAREKELERRRNAKLIGFGGRTKRQRIQGPDESTSRATGSIGHKSDSGITTDDDDQFLPLNTGSSGGSRLDQGDDNVSAEVKALLQQFKTKATEEEDVEEERPKIFYTSRTHTQLRQLTSELLKTTFACIPEESDPSIDPPTTSADAVFSNGSIGDQVDIPTRMVPLASRRQLCINEKAVPKDIEDIVQLGKQVKVCPYYATRNSVKQAELVTMPYNLLLQKSARETMGISLKDQVVVVDEAHNLIDTLLSIHSVSISLERLGIALGQLDVYLRKFKNRLKPEHSLHVKQMTAMVRGLIDVASAWASQDNDSTTSYSAKEELFSINDLTNKMKGGADQINIVSLCRYLKDSQLARKISGYAEKLMLDNADTKTKGSGSSPYSAISAFRQVETFLLSLTDADLDGRIIISRSAVAKSQEPGRDPDSSRVTLRYMLLNPAEHFQSVIDEARCVVLAGGTMEPLSDFYLQLFPSIPRTRFSNLSCAHVIPRENLLTQVILQGPSKKELEFKFDKRGDPSLLVELGTLLANIINLVPDGVVIFLPSYSFLGKLKEVWQGNGTLNRLDAKKKLFFEPQSSAEVDSTLTQYADAIAKKETKRTGAIMFAVVGGKLSEGINFSDQLGRCVVMVGLPFANMGSVELRERMKYVEGLPNAGKNAGQELYEKLPKWIGQDLKVGNFPEAMRNVAGFFKAKKAHA
ncbi:hypothetical protein QFC21_005482 [Naganishia friedmannii]|uniref:Uncharacterized protein n=1 Tax=Naganishia friedmannii TaxID=89922 RepID=A0ACC2V9Q4_9TREE|nr:hypothetical protein QFC21_005482 [Naganishia friedmannii]